MKRALKISSDFILESEPSTHPAPAKMNIFTKCQQMRKVILSVNVTLDGFMSGPDGELDWHFSIWNDEMGNYALQQLRDVDTILLGRITYQSMAGYWPGAFTAPGSNKKDMEFAQRMNAYAKIVFSNTLTTVEWNNSRLAGKNIADEILTLKMQEGKDIIMWGGVGIVYTFIELGLIDEYRIWVNPVAIGKGIPLFDNLNKRLDLKLTSALTFSNGVVLLNYVLKNNFFHLNAI